MICELSDQGLIKIQGNDAKKFLQGQLTCDAERTISLGAHCNPQGRVLSLFYLFQYQDAYYLLMQQSMVPIALSALMKYAVFFKITLTDDSKNWHVSGVINDDVSLEQAVRIPVTESLYILAGENNKIQATHETNVWHQHRIKSGIPAIYPETSGKFLPHELNLPALDAVSFDKGCYTGQEIIARMHYRGKLKTHLYHVNISSAHKPELAADIYGEQGKACGMVVDMAHDVYNNQYDLLITANGFDNKININNKIKDGIHVHKS